MIKKIILSKDSNKNVKKPYTVQYEDKLGTIYRVEKYDENDNLLEYYIYEYDKKMNPVSVKAYDKNGNLKN